MKIIRSIVEMQTLSSSLKAKGKRIGLVPTMGYLHEGHLSLVRIAKKHADVVIVSIFVNPTQFGPHEDFDNYPRDFERDEALCKEEGTDIVFYPSVGEMYGEGYSVYVNEERLSSGLCGRSRPGHFRGVTTVVSKLFNSTLPHVAVFGEKDAQQLRILRQLARDLNFPIDIIGGPIVREDDGLAMSSRNRYLSDEERRDALHLSRSLSTARNLYESGEHDAKRIVGAARGVIEEALNNRIDYVELVDADTFESVERIDRPALLALAVHVGKARLLDNTVLG